MDVSKPARTGDRFYLRALVAGLGVTIRHFFRNLTDRRNIPTIDYPEQRRPISIRLRARHRLTLREDGSGPKCVACYLCATACPARCIHIVAAEDPDPTVEKLPAKFDIDLLRCVYCGFCVEACPKDAIRMDTGIYTITGASRKSFIATKETLMATPAATPEVLAGTMAAVSPALPKAPAAGAA